MRTRLLDWIERAGNRLPDPAFLFLGALVLTWAASALLAPVAFTDVDPRTLTAPTGPAPLRVHSQLTGGALATFLARMVKNFTEFPPLGVVLVAMLGVGVAEHTGFIGAALRALLGITARRLLTPMVLFVAILSHATGDTGYVLVIPLGGAIYAAAGRHPLVGIAAAFAGVAGGFSASFLPAALDPLLQGFTQSAAQIIDPGRTVNVLCNWWFTSASCLLIVAVGWWVTERVVEPRVAAVAVAPDEDTAAALPEGLTPPARRGLVAALATMAAGLAGVALAAWPEGSPLRARDGGLTGPGAPLMDAIVPLIFLLFLVPGTVYGRVAGTVRTHRDLVAGMTKSMSVMGYYLVLAFFAAQFTYAFRESNLGALVAMRGAALLRWAAVPTPVTVVGIVVIAALIDVLVGSASAKWAVLAPILVPMLMQVGVAPELTQAAYRIGDSTSNVITPLNPYFPLVVVYCQRWVPRSGIGTLVSLMLPYSIAFLVTWSLLLLAFWGLDVPLGLQASHAYP